MPIILEEVTPREKEKYYSAHYWIEIIHLSLSKCTFSKQSSEHCFISPLESQNTNEMKEHNIKFA